MRAERMVAVSLALLRDAITGIFGLIKDAVTVFVNPKGHNEIARTDERLEANLQNLCNKTVDEKLRSVV